jgi:hypothetical protein
MNSGGGSVSHTPILQAWIPEFKPQSHQKKKRKENETELNRFEEENGLIQDFYTQPSDMCKAKERYWDIQKHILPLCSSWKMWSADTVPMTEWFLQNK